MVLQLSHSLTEGCSLGRQIKYFTPHMRQCLIPHVQHILKSCSLFEGQALMNRTKAWQVAASYDRQAELNLKKKNWKKHCKGLIGPRHEKKQTTP